MTDVRHIDPELRDAIWRHLVDRNRREAELLALMRDMLDVMKSLRRLLPVGEDGAETEERPRPN